MRIGSESSCFARWGWTVLLIGAVIIGGCSTSEVGPSHPNDSTPPSAAPMQIDAITAGTITFTWRAPGDDGISGLATGYDLRYSPVPLTDETWPTATPALGNVTPDTPNSLERYTITGLTPGTTYYFSMKTYDEVPNYSAMSSVFCVTIPLVDTSPIPLNAMLLTSSGTTYTSFIFRMDQLLIDGYNDTGDIQGVVIDDSLYAMTYMPREFDEERKLYEFATRLESGAHSCYFQIKRDGDGGESTRMPSDGTWSIDSVVDVTLSEFDTRPVTAGTFLMGTNDLATSQIERPEHEVTLTRDIDVSRLEITNAQLCNAYNWALEQNLIYVENDSLVYIDILIPDGDDLRYFLLRCATRQAVVDQGIQWTEATGFTPVAFRENWPAIHVSWFGAINFCNFKSLREGLTPAYIWDDRQEYWRCDTSGGAPYEALGWRLPSEAEWEYFAQYNDGRTYVTGNEIPAAGVDGNFGSVVGEPADVGSYPAAVNELGIEDLAGNVWEWCNDWNMIYSADAVTDPSDHVLSPITVSRSLRGGCWGSPPEELRCKQRFSQKPTRVFNWLGFRCVKSIIENPEE